MKMTMMFSASLSLLLRSLLQIGAVSSSSVAAAGAAAEDVDNDSSSSYVFLQKFPLQNTMNSIFHTEVLVCLQSGFTTEEQKFLDNQIVDLKDFVEISEDWWSTITSNCIEYGYGGAPCTERCCGSPHTTKQKHFPLNDHRSVIGNADTTQKTLYLYGSTQLPSDKAWNELCPSDPNHQPCWSNWSGIDYNPLTNNCNTFTSTLLHCIFGLSEAKPNLGPSDMVTVTCDKCPLLLMMQSSSNNNNEQKLENRNEIEEDDDDDDNETTGHGWDKKKWTIRDSNNKAHNLRQSIN